MSDQDKSQNIPNFNLSRIADFLNETGMLKHTPRSGFPFLGSGKENVAEHSFRTTVIGYVLALMANADCHRTMLLCLFHDLHEARTGDFNYVNHRYDTCDAKQALEDATRGTGLGNIIMGLWQDLENSAEVETLLAKDADQLDLICNLQVELCKGNLFAREWLDSALKRLRTTYAQKLADAILRVDPNNWWYNQVDKSWWINHSQES